MLGQIQRWTLVVALAILSVVAITACGSSSDDSTSASTDASTETAASNVPDVPFVSPENSVPIGYPERDRNADLKIGLLNPRAATESLSILFGAAKSQVEENGGTVVELDAEQDPDKQISQFEQLINEGVDAIGMVPIAEPKLIGPVLGRAEKAGIPVIGLEVTPGKPGKVPGFASQVWQRRDYQTYLKVKATAEALGSGAKVGEIAFAIPVPLFVYAEERTAYWAKQFGLDLVDVVKSADDSVDAGQEAAEGLLARNPDMVGIIGYNDEPAIGAALAAKAAGRDEVETFGNGGGNVGLDAIESDRLTATVLFDSAAEGRTLADGLYDVAEKVAVPPVVRAGEPFIITAANLDEARAIVNEESEESGSGK